MANNIYIGARYVPMFADPVEWDNLRTYEPLTIVTYQGTSYTSKKAVPVGIALNNTEYWVVTGNYNAQVQSLANDVSELSTEVSGLDSDVSALATRMTAAEGDITAIQNIINNLPESFKIIDTNGNGDYTTLAEAIADSDGHTLYALIMPGVYDNTYVSFRSFDYVCLIGADKNNTILQNSDGHYNKPVIDTNSNFYLANLSLKSFANPGFTPTYNTSDVIGTFPNYTIHSDADADVGDGVIENCNVYSQTNSCLGAGVQQNSSLTLKNTEFNRVSEGAYVNRNGSSIGGAVLVHSSNIGSDEQYFTMENCIVSCNFYESAVFNLAIAASGAGFYGCWRNNYFVQYVTYLKGSSNHINSYGNNAGELNTAVGTAANVLADFNYNGSASEVSIPLDLTKGNYLFVGCRQSANYGFGGSVFIPLDLVRRAVKDNIEFYDCFRVLYGGGDTLCIVKATSLNSVIITHDNASYPVVSGYIV